MGGDQTLQRLQIVKDQCCSPPVPHVELQRIAKNCSTKGALRVDSAASIASGAIPEIIIEDVGNDADQRIDDCSKIP
ncbi:MAG: hypothetical protein VYA84_05215 [Planctomycetota bacterium]|nr:hypothetical protein [Planctomycetota bacterium]